MKQEGLVLRMPGEERVGVNRTECSNCRKWQKTLMGEERSLCGTQMAVCVPFQGNVDRNRIPESISRGM